LDFDYVIMPAILVIAGILIAWLSIRRIKALPAKDLPQWRRILERVFLSLILVVAAAVATSSAFNAIALHHFWSSHPPTGQLVKVNGHTMYIHCAGSGAPTLILDAGLGNDSTAWAEAQPELSKTTRVCSYDRAGFGWSDALAAPRDADHIADELHQLLIEAKITGPMVLMAHSISGLYARDYAARYPQEVAGLVLIDVSTPCRIRIQPLPLDPRVRRRGF
jgi:hypothetical protein